MKWVATLIQLMAANVATWLTSCKEGRKLAKQRLSIRQPRTKCNEDAKQGEKPPSIQHRCSPKSRNQAASPRKIQNQSMHSSHGHGNREVISGRQLQAQPIAPIFRLYGENP